MVLSSDNSNQPRAHAYGFPPHPSTRLEPKFTTFGLTDATSIAGSTRERVDLPEALSAKAISELPYQTKRQLAGPRFELADYLTGQTYTAIRVP